jgi:hypothetical protein
LFAADRSVGYRDPVKIALGAGWGCGVIGFASAAALESAAGIAFLVPGGFFILAGGWALRQETEGVRIRRPRLQERYMGMRLTPSLAPGLIVLGLLWIITGLSAAVSN